MAETKKPVATVKKVAAKKEEVKAEAKAAVKSVAKKVEPAKAEEKKAAAEKKAPAKKAAAKPAAKKVAAKKVDTKATLSVQFAGKDYKEADLIKMAKDAYKADGNKDALKTLDVYANVDDQVAYYVANGDIKGSFAI